MTVVDRKTRGRTASGRLAALDAFLVHRERPLLARTAGEGWRLAPFVDVGFGEHPATTLEAASLFRTLHPELPVVGLEREPHRVEGALAHGDGNTRFERGGFPELAGRGARLVRVMNVLRGYREEEVQTVHQQLGAGLREGGLLVEGTSSPEGAILTCHLWRRERDALVHEGLLFHTTFAHGFAPRMFRDWLPRDLRRRVQPGTAIHRFLEVWTEAWEMTASAAPRGDIRPEPAQRFIAAAQALCDRGEAVEPDPWLREHGYLLWTPGRHDPPRRVALVHP